MYSWHWSRNSIPASPPTPLQQLRCNTGTSMWTRFKINTQRTKHAYWFTIHVYATQLRKVYIRQMYSSNIHNNTSSHWLLLRDITIYHSISPKHYFDLIELLTNVSQITTGYWGRWYRWRAGRGRWRRRWRITVCSVRQRENKIWWSTSRRAWRDQEWRTAAIVKRVVRRITLLGNTQSNTAHNCVIKKGVMITHSNFQPSIE